MDSSNDVELKALQNGNPNPGIYSGIGAASRQLDKPLGERRKAVLRQLLMVILANTGVIGAGMGIVLSISTYFQFQNVSALSFTDLHWLHLITKFSLPLGVLLAACLLDTVGRKRTMLLGNLVGIIGWLFIIIALPDNTNYLCLKIFIGQSMIGIMIGLFYTSTGIYMAEITLPKVRGILLLGTALALSFGMLIMTILSDYIADYQLLVMISFCYQIFSFFCVLPIPETPSWLMQKRRSVEAKKSLLFFRGLDKSDNCTHPEIETELSQIQKTSAEASTASLLTSIKQPEVYKPLLIMISLFAFQQFSDLPTMYYIRAFHEILTPKIVNSDSGYGVFLELRKLFTMFFVAFIVEKLGRRSAGIILKTVISITTILLGVCTLFPVIEENIPQLLTFLTIMHLIICGIGFHTLPFYMISEVFPQKVRGVASGMTVCIGFVMFEIVFKMQPIPFRNSDDGYKLVFYDLVALAAVVYVYFMLPETKDKSLLEIEEYFRTGRYPAITVNR